jgi:hypothetical protein
MRVTKIKYLAIVVCTLLLFIGCTTQEYQNIRSQCDVAAYRIYPPKFESRVENVRVPVDVPTGEISCQTVNLPGGVANTRCQQVTKTEYKDSQKVVHGDINERPRIDHSYFCAQQTCTQLFGNSQCEINSNGGRKMTTDDAIKQCKSQGLTVGTLNFNGCLKKYTQQ